MFIEKRPLHLFSPVRAAFVATMRQNAALTGLEVLVKHAAIDMPSLRDSRGFWSLQGFCVKSGAVGKPHP